MYFGPLFWQLINYLLFLAIVALVSLAAWNVWISYVQTLFLQSIKWSLIEIRSPKEVFKSPAAMEIVLNALHVGGQGADWFTKYWKGEVSLWHSLEIVSIEGKVHFFIRTPTKFKKTIETQIYAQYPQAEIVDAEDYTIQTPDYSKDGSINLWGALLKLKKDEAYPIKTYVEYGLDRTVGLLKEEERIDPIAPMLEFFGSLGAGEQAWVQILIKPDTKRFKIKNKEGVEEGGKSWTDKAKELIKEIKKSSQEKDEEGKVIANLSTKRQNEIIEAIERNISKFAFDSAIRMIYLANKDNFNPNNIAGMLGAVKQYDSIEMNGFKPEGTPKVNFPWQDLSGNKVAAIKKDLLSAYKSRGYFYGNFSFGDIKKYFTNPQNSGGQPFILTTEEIATMYHLPGRVVETPNFVRLESKKGEPPANLPI